MCYNNNMYIYICIYTHIINNVLRHLRGALAEGLEVYHIIAYYIIFDYITVYYNIAYIYAYMFICRYNLPPLIIIPPPNKKKNLG